MKKRFECLVVFSVLVVIGLFMNKPTLSSAPEISTNKQTPTVTVSIVSLRIFKLDTTTWSNSDKFYVKAYDYVPIFKDKFTGLQAYVTKAVGNPAHVTFSGLIDDDVDYMFRLDNTVYGERIVGSGKWTLTDIN